MRRTIWIKTIAWILMMVILVGAGSTRVLADPVTLQPPQHNRVSDIGYTDTFYSNQWYADLEWDPAIFPDEADEKVLYLGLNEVAYGTGQLLTDALTVAVPGSATEYKVSEYYPEGIKNGTIYQSTVKSSYVINSVTGKNTVTSHRSNPTKFLTGLNVSLELVAGTNNIKIKWDDVWDTDGRINYQVLISDTKGFTQPDPIPDISASDIGSGTSAVTVNTKEKKLEYIYTGALPGREYSIKVVPHPNSDVMCVAKDKIKAVTIKTDILLKAKRVGYTSEGDVIWELFWNPIVKGSTFTRVDYELYRYTDGDPEGQLFRLIPDFDSYRIIIDKDDPATYSFKMDAKAYVEGSAAPIDFRSNNKVVLEEQIPQKPEAPNIVDSFPDADPEPLTYEDYLTSSSATVFWTVPYTGKGFVDSDVTYDIYLLKDIRDISEPSANYKIASDLSMEETNQIRSKKTGAVIGCQYNLEELESNTSYYFVIYAKKNFLVQSATEDYMVSTPYISSQTVKVIITEPDIGADRPIAPSVPPLGIYPGTDSVTYTDAALVLEKTWHALFNEENGRWEFASEQEYKDNYLLDEADPEKHESTIVEYPAGWKVVPHVVSYNDALNVIRMRNNGRKNVTYSDLSQSDIKAFEIAQQAVSIPDIDPEADDQSFTFDVTGLTHNSTYLVWVTIENQNGTSSDPSDAIIITTPPEIDEKPVTPTIPSNLRGVAGDSFVDLFWSFTKDMNYEIKGGTSDHLGAAFITSQVSYEELKSGTFCRIENLEPDTVYYFWIKAINNDLQSNYSNPLVIVTDAYAPPAPPTGFGIESVTESTIAYLWGNKTGFAYYLEFSDNNDFRNSIITEVSGGSYTVSNLIANRRYYARLFAYEIKTGLRSEPTRTILVITNKSKSEYDGSYDLDEPVGGNGLVVPAKLEDGVWVVSSLGDNAHVLGQRIRAQHSQILKLDLSKPPVSTNTIRLNLDSTVFEVLSGLKKELYIKLPWGQIVIRPSTFHTSEYFKQKALNGNLAISIETVSTESSYKPSSYMQIKTPVSALKISYMNVNSAISELVRSIRVELPVEGLKSYGQEKIKAYSVSKSGNWYSLPTFSDYTNSQIVGELGSPGAVVAAAWGIQADSGMPEYISERLDKIQSVFKLKSLEGKRFNDKASMTQKDALKLILDVIPADYTNSDMNEKASLAGLINSAFDVTDANARRDKAVYMLVSLYKFKTHESTVPSKPDIWFQYSDLSKAEKGYLQAYQFALENGIIRGNGSNLVYPDKIINWGDFLVMLARILEICGEL